MKEAGAGAEELRAEVRATTELFLRRHVPDSWDEFAQAMRTASVVYGSLSQQLNSLKRQLEFYRKKIREAAAQPIMVNGQQIGVMCHLCLQSLPVRGSQVNHSAHDATCPAHPDYQYGEEEDTGA